MIKFITKIVTSHQLFLKSSYWRSVSLNQSIFYLFGGGLITGATDHIFQDTHHAHLGVTELLKMKGVSG